MPSDRDQLAFDIELSQEGFASDRIEQSGTPVVSESISGVFYGVDFGSNDALAIHGPDGPIPVKQLSIRGGASQDKFMRVLPYLLEGAPWLGVPAGHVVVESATIGSCGVEPEDVKEIVDNLASTSTLFVLSTRAVKNYRKTHGIPWEQKTHADDAKIIYTIAIEQFERLCRWKMPSDSPLRRRKTSARPHDKRKYEGPEPDRWMAMLPPFKLLPQNLKELLGMELSKRTADYSRSKAMPFAMAMEEDGADTRSGYEKVIGLYDHGYPSFYRRNVVTIMQDVAKKRAGVTTNDEVSSEQRKEAWRVTRRDIRQLWHLMMNNKDRD